MKGLLGFICMIYTYIWGWMHVKDGSLNLKTWMWISTGAIVLGIILNIIAQDLGERHIQCPGRIAVRTLPFLRSLHRIPDNRITRRKSSYYYSRGSFFIHMLIS